MTQMDAAPSASSAANGHLWPSTVGHANPVSSILRVKSNTRLVYSTATDGKCAVCGWPQRDCKCSSQRAANAAIPARIVAKLRMEKKGRGGKTVTVVYGLPENEAFLKELSQDLKRACGTGGAVADGEIELQGDLRERVRNALIKKGFVVKG